MLNLNQTQIISIAINASIFIILTISSFLIINKLKLEQNGYKYLFILYTMFWIPIMLVRPYRGTIQNWIDVNFTTIALSIYGFVGIFVRIFADAINYLFKHRKAFLYICAISELCLFLPLVIHPTSATNILSSIGIGIGASCIGTYELLFKEQYGNKKAFLTVSVLSIPPLLANFLTAPIQSLIKTVATTIDATGQNQVDPNILRYLWLIAIPFLVISFIMIFFLREKRMIVGIELGYYKDLRKNSNLLQDWSFFIILAIIGSLIAFIKFSNSDAMATLHIQNLGLLTKNNVAPYEGYISVIFSLFQLLAGILMGMVLIKKIDTIKIFLIGSSTWIIYLIASTFIQNPIGYFCIHSLNGFGYGILYNLILAIVLNISLKNKIVTKMGIYQSILSIGITVSSFFTTWLKNLLPHGNNINTNELHMYMHDYLIENMILLAVVIIATILFISFTLITKNSKKESQTIDIKKNKHFLKKKCFKLL